jgi:hypothetical protein
MSFAMKHGCARAKPLTALVVLVLQYDKIRTEMGLINLVRVYVLENSPI